MSRLIDYLEAIRHVGCGLRNLAFRVGLCDRRGVHRRHFTRARGEILQKVPVFADEAPPSVPVYMGTHFRLLAGTWLYGNHFDVERNRLYVRELVKDSERQPIS